MPQLCPMWLRVLSVRSVWANRSVCKLLLPTKTLQESRTEGRSSHSWMPLHQKKWTSRQLSSMGVSGTSAISVFFCDFENLFIRVGKSPENVICRHPFFSLTFSILTFIVLIYRVEPVVWLSPFQIAVHLNTCGGFSIGWWENRPTLQHRAASIQSAVVVVTHALWPALVPSQGVHRALIHPVHRCLAEEALALPVALVIRVVLALNAPQCQLATLALVAK